MNVFIDGCKFIKLSQTVTHTSQFEKQKLTLKSKAQVWQPLLSHRNIKENTADTSTVLFTVLFS